MHPQGSYFPRRPHIDTQSRRPRCPLASTLSAREPFSLSLNGLELPRSALCCTSFAHGFLADVKHPLDFHTIQLALSGNIQFSAGHHSVDSNIETGVMLSAGQRVKVTSLPGNICLSYIVQDEVIRDVLSSWTL